MLKDFKIPPSKYFIIDCDVGGDDALCIIMAALICKKYDKVLLGITCVAGNTTLPNVVTNALISCKIAGISVPIFKGTIRLIQAPKRTSWGVLLSSTQTTSSTLTVSQATS